MEYVRHRRLEAAYSMLTKTRLPIILIAADVGIPNLAHFNRLMHKQYGGSPRELRRRAWENAPPEQSADTIETVRRPHFYYQF
jgi:transcriptional regulator GlxA family with amidase domain